MDWVVSDVLHSHEAAKPAFSVNPWLCPAQMDGLDGLIFADITHAVNSSAPISGVEPFLAWLSISVVMVAITCACASSVEIFCKCRSEVEVYNGFTSFEFASFPVPVCHAARFALLLPIKPKFVPVPL